MVYAITYLVGAISGAALMIILFLSKDPAHGK